MRINGLFRRLILGLTLLAFTTASVPSVYPQTLIPSPAPGTAVALSERCEPPLMVGLRLDDRQPFQMGFIFDRGQDILTAAEKRQEYLALISYFLTSLTIPNRDMWVNLAPHEAQRIMPDNFSLTGMGRDLLAQDYFLKQITASLLDPRTAVGKVFWEKVYAAAQDRYGTTYIPVDTFNKVWIIPDRAAVYEKNGTALTVESHLRVMLQEDYAALENSQKSFAGLSAPDQSGSEASALSSAMIREVVLPVLEREVNEGKSFARLRQVYSAMILATWFKQRLKKSLLGQVYADRSKVAGVEVDDPQAKEKIYQKYLDAYTAGVFNFVREERDPLTNELIPRKYFSGGILALDKVGDGSQAQAEALGDNLRKRVALVKAEFRRKGWDSWADLEVLKALIRTMIEEAEEAEAARKKFWEDTFKGILVFFGFKEWGHFLSQFLSGTSLLAGSAVLIAIFVVPPVLDNPSSSYAARAQPVEQTQAKSVAPPVRSASSAGVHNNTMTLAKTVAAMEAKYRAGSVEAYNWLNALGSYNSEVSSYMDFYAYEYVEKVIAEGSVQELAFSDKRIKHVLANEGLDISSVIERARNGSTSDIFLLEIMLDLNRPGLDKSIVTSIVSKPKFWNEAIDLWVTGKGEQLMIWREHIPPEISERLVVQILGLDSVSRNQVMKKLPGEILAAVNDSLAGGDTETDATISNLENRTGVLNQNELLSITNMQIFSRNASSNTAYTAYLEQGNNFSRLVQAGAGRGDLAIVLQSLPEKFYQKLAADTRLMPVIARAVEIGAVKPLELPSRVTDAFFSNPALFGWMKQKARAGNSRVIEIMSNHKEGAAILQDWSEELSAGSKSQKSATPDNAAKGGIDFNEDLLNLQIRRDDKGLPLPMTLQDPAMLNIQGLVPVIQDIRSFDLSVVMD